MRYVINVQIANDLDFMRLTRIRCAESKTNMGNKLSLVSEWS